MTDALTAQDLRTVACVPITPYCHGWEDAYYQDVYNNPYKRDTKHWKSYDEGHEHGMRARTITREAM